MRGARFGLGARTLGLEPRESPKEAPRRTSAGPRPHVLTQKAGPTKSDGRSDFAKKSDDLEAIKKAVDDAASVGGLWLSYLFVLFYFAVAAGAVTNEDLFLENPVKLPFFGIDLPLAGSGPHWRMALIDVAVTPIRSRSMISAHRSHRP
jgi:hypothetical protein